MNSTDTLSAAAEALQKHFGFRVFLDGQDKVIESILEGRDTLAIMPTGGGKSLCYQLPAVMREGVTVVVSPLIALMKDQVDALDRRGIPATVINSSQTPGEQRERLAALRRGDFKMVYVAPERFRSEGFTDALAQANLTLFAVDEAHCLSQWGHDFRPDYLRLGQALDRLGRPQVAAFTATATPEVRQDIRAQLRLKDGNEFVTGFERPNLRLGVVQSESSAAKYERLARVVQLHRTGIIYCSTRKRVDEVFATLRSQNIRCIAYHGGMDDRERSRIQDEFITRQADVAVATNAFGMGIDRPDIRFVVHFDLPGSIEAYYQEVGRAGRDGEPAVAELLFNYADRRTQEFFIEGSNPSPALIRAVFGLLLNLADSSNEIHLSVRDLAERLSDQKTNDMAVGAALSLLARKDYIDRFDVPGERRRGTRVLRTDLTPARLPLDTAALQEKERRDQAKLRSMVDFCYADQCRQQIILLYFGEKDAPLCGNCDACLRAEERRKNPAAAPAKLSGPFAPAAPEKSAPPAGGWRKGSPDEILVARKALSGVARMSLRDPGGQWRGRFGKGKIIQTLLGSRSQEILSAGLDQLSTHSILKDEGSAYLQSLFRSMSLAGWLVTEPGEYPLTTLTERGDKIMRDLEPAVLDWPERAPSAPAPPRDPASASADPAAGLAPADRQLFDLLRAKRRELAAAADIPAYMIFPDATLRLLASARPVTEEQAINLRGIGEAKARKYLPPFLQLIRDQQPS